METNNIFSTNRFILLCREAIIINKKIITYTAIGSSLLIFVLLVLFQYFNHFNNWGLRQYMPLFLMLFFVFGINYVGNAFPAFRSKDKSLTYLLLPATAYEKFAFEIAGRIVLYFLLIPLIYWSVVYIESSIIHLIIPHFEKFNILKIDLNSANIGIKTPKDLPRFSLVNNALCLFLIAFTGASHFMKSPVLKTFLTLAVVYMGSGALIYLLGKGLNLGMNDLKLSNSFFFKNQVSTIFTISAIIINLSLLAIAFFRLKEKEV